MPFRLIHVVAFSCVFLFYMNSSSSAEQHLSFTPSDRLPISGHLTIKTGNSVREVALADLETLPMHEVTASITVEEPIKTFEGILLRDVLAYLGALDAEEITVRGDDAYAASIPQKDWKTWPVLLATRSEGKPLTLRQRGPARVIYPMQDFEELNHRRYRNRSVWMVQEIQW